MKKTSPELPIYNCHIHTFINYHVPRHFLKMIMGPVFGVLVSELLRWRPLARVLIPVLKKLVRSSDRDIFERYGRFLETELEPLQAKVFERIARQYPKDRTSFVVLPVDMTFMKLGKLDKSIKEQHEELWKLSQSPEGKQIIPFYAVDPRWDDIIQRVKENVGEGKFCGIKIYPNMGYMPDDDKLLEVYKICVERDIPVISHCTPYGVYQYRLNLEDRTKFSYPENYKRIYAHKELKKLRMCLAHFGGETEWERHLKSRDDVDQNPAWVKVIGDMIRSGEYPNLYTDISYTVFTPHRPGVNIDLYDYLNVLLQNELLRTHVLFGSDYYMVEKEEMTEKEVSIALRSRLGEELYFQIAYHNPRKYLGI
jgi:predicted TIM-barrel fold metal-dependent hydrolase